MDLKQLEYFVRVSEVGSFTRAAALLHVAQPTLSRQIAQLEIELKVQLLTRNGRGVLPTEAGKRLLEHSRGILRQVALAHQELTASKDAGFGRIAVGAPASIAASITVPLVEAFRRELPNVGLSILQARSTALLEWLVSARIDMAVIYEAPYSPLVTNTMLLTEKLALIQKKPIDPAPIKLAELSRYPLIIPSRPNTMRLQIETELARIGLKPQISLEVDNVPNILELVAKGFASAVLSPRAAAMAPPHFNLGVRPIIEPSLEISLSLSNSARAPDTQLRQRAAHIVESVSRKVLGDNAVGGQSKSSHRDAGKLVRMPEAGSG